MEKEVRNYNLDVRALDESRSVEGYALVFNSLSEDLGGFREQIDSNALNGVLERSDVMALLNHDSSRGILARSRYGEGSLTLTVDEKGLRYNFEAPHSALGDEVLEYLRRCDINQSSFAFTVSSDSWEKQSDGSYLRTITGFDRLFDVSPVFTPAYAATSVKCARFEAIQEEERLENERLMKEAEERAAEEEEKKDEEKKEALKTYYEKIREDYKEYLK
jgi:HK97 family phage prohead protease